MRTFRGAFAAPVMVGLLITATGCGAASAPSAPLTTTATSTAQRPSSTAASPSSAASHVSTASAPASSRPPSQPSPRPSASASSAFPGIWDITSWEQYREAQAAVEQGHQPWLLDPVSVVQAWASRWAPNLPVSKIADDTYRVTEPGTQVVYTIRGTRPDPTGPAPIWVITQITHS